MRAWILAERIADQQTSARFAEARAAVDRGEEVASARRWSSTPRSSPPASCSADTSPARCPRREVAVESGFLRIRQRGKFLGFGAEASAPSPTSSFLRLLDSLLGRPTAIPQDRDFAGRANVG